jgi:hypothetical protein
LARFIRAEADPLAAMSHRCIDSGYVDFDEIELMSPVMATQMRRVLSNLPVDPSEQL